jgi:hypothetical protein
MPSELELNLIVRLEALEKEVAALKKKLAAARPAEAQRARPEKKEAKGNVK